MKNLTEWTFSEAAFRVDFPRIIREAERATYPLPCLLRVTIEDKHVVTLVHRECLDGFIANGRADKVDAVLEAPALTVNQDLCAPSLRGERAVGGHLDDESSSWIAILGDHVGALADRVEVKVEVY